MTAALAKSYVDHIEDALLASERRVAALTREVADLKARLQTPKLAPLPPRSVLALGRGESYRRARAAAAALPALPAGSLHPGLTLDGDGWRLVSTDQVVKLTPTEGLVMRLLWTRVGKIVTTEAMIDAVWGHRPPATPTHSLHVATSRLRAKLRVFRADGCLVSVRGIGWRLTVTS